MRRAVVSGSFYPNDEKEISKYIEHFNNSFSIEEDSDLRKINPKSNYLSTCRVYL